MASIASLQAIFGTNTQRPSTFAAGGFHAPPSLSASVAWKKKNEINKKRRCSTVVAAVGDVSADGTTYLIAGAAAVALLGTAFPLLFSRKDL
jgi:hypothetical protein